MVTLKGIQETHPRVSHHGILQMVNSKNGERVFWENFIQICKVHADLPLPILLLHHHSVGQPLEIEDLLNGSNLLQLVYLYPYRIGVIFG